MREWGDLGEEEDDPTDSMSLSSDGKSHIEILLLLINYMLPEERRQAECREKLACKNASGKKGRGGGGKMKFTCEEKKKMAEDLAKKHSKEQVKGKGKGKGKETTVKRNMQPGVVQMEQGMNSL